MDFVAEEGVEALKQSLRSVSQGGQCVRQAVAADLLLGELVQKLFPIFRTAEALLKAARQELRAADAAFGSASAELDAALTRWQPGANQFRDCLRDRGRRAQEHEIAELKKSWPIARAAEFRASLDLSFACLSVDSSQSYGRSREFVLSMVERIRVAAADDMLGGGTEVLGMATFEELFEGLNRIQAQIEAAQEGVAAASTNLSNAWQAYGARRSALTKQLQYLSEGAKWALFWLVCPEDAEKVDALA
ncbi:hypothetical protein [Roseateles sp.]|uniref:hypothetical protein n=1 Tax=Roseateles sp. TaxID=1971397 RepID=UPI0039EBBD27